jgi:hypothetical protein
MIGFGVIEAMPKTSGISADEFCIDFAVRSEWPRSHSKYRACVFLTARVQCRWAAGEDLRQSGAWRAIFIFLPAKVTRRGRY